jgi:hypothetical protein
VPHGGSARAHTIDWGEKADFSSLCHTIDWGLLASLGGGGGAALPQCFSFVGRLSARFLLLQRSTASGLNGHDGEALTRGRAEHRYNIVVIIAA